MNGHRRAGGDFCARERFGSDFESGDGFMIGNRGSSALMLRPLSRF